MYIRKAKLQELLTISRLDRESNMTPWVVMDYLWCYESKKHEIYLLCDEADEIAGLMTLGIFDNEIDVLQFFIITKYHRQGLGKFFLNDAITRMMNDSRYDAMFLEVRVDNDAAIALYSKLGFEIINTREAYYNIQGRKCDAFVMKRALKEMPATSTVQTESSNQQHMITSSHPINRSYTKRDYPLM